ncbi:CU044_2847 family protein [Streptomyces sp. 71268]|uniref:CU044_2847 family protein n=1 Tax=Streptomyces sp. 71268 TaxID=3002640 RepID=UPI0023F7361F|nr:CU044_2847 family protein [Streptomyces sp. 71268]WEV25188.1 CU044_2847 family protein [Streptomyces sp. 71268]
MGDLALTFDDGTVAWLRLTPVADGARPAPVGPAGATGGGAPDSAHGSESGDGGDHGDGGADDRDGAPDGPYGQPPEPDLELPSGFGGARAVSVDSRTARALSAGGQALANALRPLSGVLESIHTSLADSPRRPDEVTVQFGVTLGTDLSLGVFTGKGEANFSVSATWNLGSTSA